MITEQQRIDTINKLTQSNVTKISLGKSKLTQEEIFIDKQELIDVLVALQEYRQLDKNFLGYLSVYLYLEFADDTATIVSIHVDFRKGVNAEILKEFRESAYDFYKTKGLTVTGYRYVSEKAYQAFLKRYPENQGTTISFNENGTVIKSLLKPDDLK